MEAVDGMMEKMNLSEAERKGIKVRSGGGGASTPSAPMAIGKVLAERPVNADGLGIALGKVWCPIEGIECKDLGENHFLFTFLQAASKKKALEDGPWVFGKDLIVVVDFDGKKRVEDLKFDHIPIWIWASGIPLGMMNKETGAAIGNEVGDFVCMELEEDGIAVGQFLRIKVKLNITKPPMRGISLVTDENEKPLWCPLVYEFLPEFCYLCGIIGHTDKICAVEGVVKGVQQLSKKLRFLLEKKRWEEGSNAVGVEAEGVALGVLAAVVMMKEELVSVGWCLRGVIPSHGKRRGEGEQHIWGEGRGTRSDEPSEKVHSSA